MTRPPGRPFVVLDVDDTLVATYALGLDKCQWVAEDLGLPPLTARQYAGVYGRLPFEACVASWYPYVEVARFTQAYDALAGELAPRPIGDLPQLLAAARETGFGVGILTNGTLAKTERKVLACGVRRDQLDFVRTSDTSGVLKPQVSAFDDLAAEGVRLDASWYVSDSAADWAGCASSGLRSVGVVAAAPTAATRPVVADLVVPDVDALTQALAALTGLPPREPWRTRPARPRAIGFDAGFTLIEDREDPVSLVARKLAENGIVVTQGEVSAAFAASTHWLASTAFWAHPASIEETLLGFYAEVLHRLHGEKAAPATSIVEAYVTPANWRLCAGAVEAVRLARRAGVWVGFLSNWQAGLSAVLEAFGLAMAGDAVVSSATHGVAKPRSAAFEALARAQGVEVAELTYVGDDATSDAAGALAAGCRAVLVPRGSPPGHLEAAVEMALPEESQPASTA